MDSNSYPADQNFGGPPTTSAGFPTPVDAYPSNFASTPSLSLGMAVPTLPSVDISVQNLIDQPVADWVVTETGNFSTNQPTFVSLTILKLVTVDLGLPTMAYQIFFQTPVNLLNLGVDLTGLLAYFPQLVSQLPPFSTQPPPPVALPPTVANPTRPIVSYDRNWILVEANDSYGFFLGGTPANPYINPPGTLFPSAPAMGQTVQIAILREGPAVTSQTNLPVINVIVATPQQPPPPVLGVQNNFTGNFRAGSGVVQHFVGAGVAAPLNDGSVVEVENQRPLAQGLPLNFFVG